MPLSKLRLPEYFVFIYKWAFFGVLIGSVAGIGAIIFALLLKFTTDFMLGYLTGYFPPLPGGEGISAMPSFDYVRWGMIPLVTTMGGLITGFLVYNYAPEAEGHGTDAVIDAFHRLGGRIRKRVPVIKVIASVITIGSGGSAGREGPIAQIGAGFGSWLASLLKLNDRDRRIMVISGAGAGIGSIFKAPLGGALFAIEVLYKRDFEVAALIPAFISSVVGYSILSSFFGFTPIFVSPEFGPTQPLSLLFYAVLGLVVGSVAILYVNVFYGIRDQVFRKLPVPQLFKPAIGGFLIGLTALLFPHVLGTGYGWIQLAILGQLAITTMLALALLKILATSFTISSGGSGGVFAPSLVIGGMLGGVVGTLLNYSFPNIVPQPASFILVGMAAFFAGAAKVPIASMIMVAEMTGNYKLLIPAMIACSISYVISGKWTIYEKQVDSRVESPAHRGEFSIDILAEVRVRSVMTTKVVTVSSNTSVSEVSRLIARYGHLGYPVVDDGKLVGIVTYSDILKVKHPEVSKVKVSNVMSRRLIVTYPDETLDVALHKMYLHDIGRLPVVDPKNPKRLLGIVTKRDLIRGHEVSRFGESMAHLKDVFSTLKVEEVMSKHFTVIEHEYSAEELMKLILTCKHPAMVFIKDGEVKGLITCKSIIMAYLGKSESPVRALPVVDGKPLVAYNDDTLRDVLDKMLSYRLEALPVMDRERPGKFLGLITLKDLIRIFALETH
jgi:CIC family chloride channel protein